MSDIWNGFEQCLAPPFLHKCITCTSVFYEQITTKRVSERPRVSLRD